MSVFVAKHESVRVVRSLAPLILIGGVLLGAAGFAWTQHLSGSGEVVAARVSLHGIDMSGMTPGEVKAVVSHDAKTTLETELTIEFGGDKSFTLDELGFTYDQASTVDNVLNARRTGGPVVQLASWAVTPLIRSRAEVAWSLDTDALLAHLRQSSDALTPVPAVEPEFSTDNRGSLTFIPGATGQTVDIDHLVDQVSGIDLLDPPDSIEARLVEVEPTVTDTAAQAVVDELTSLTEVGVLVSVRGESVRLSPEQLRQQLRVEASDGSVLRSFDLEGLQEGIENLYPEPIGPGSKPVFEVVEGYPQVIEEGTPPEVCCSAESAAKIANAVLDGDIEPFRRVALQPRPQDDMASVAVANGTLIVQQVSSFTTPHACCEDRVTNIQRMADIIDGFYLLPGEALSINDYVGERTVENGFVPAGAIRFGRLTPEVGGGVSQFATTIFNAAYFAGLDFDEYRAHSLYFSRYPYGREATISNPSPDLVIRNTTDYPVLIDTSYTDTSITVSMFSTPNVTVEEVEQRVSRRRACTHVETDRQRTYRDGFVRVDTFQATYRPAEGIDCNGNPIPEPSA